MVPGSIGLPSGESLRGPAPADNAGNTGSCVRCGAPARPAQQGESPPTPTPAPATHRRSPATTAMRGQRIPGWDHEPPSTATVADVDGGHLPAAGHRTVRSGKGQQRGTYTALATSDWVNQGIAYGARALGQRSPRSSLRAGKPSTWRRGTGVSTVRHGEVREMRDADTVLAVMRERLPAAHEHETLESRMP